jgi:putative peptide zinc metalloprotease protein
MSQNESLFSESWHRVRTQKVRLRPTVHIHKQAFRGQIWYVIEDPFNNKFFRFRPQAYAFIARLSEHKTVEEVWQQCLEETPESAPGQSEVIRMLAQLYQSSLLVSDLSPDAARLFQRYNQQKQRELKGKLLSILFIRIPLFDPDRLLKALLPLVGFLFTKFGFVFWSIMVLMGLKVVAENAGALYDQSQGMLAPDKLFLLYASFIVVKVLHEFGHGLITKKYGGEVHTAGIMLMVFNPIPYVDATAAGAFRERWKRILVGSGGMIVELFLAAIAAYVWQATDEGLLNAIAYNVMFVASVSTLLLNINPLMRFDGYYILADLTDTPNLHQRSSKHFLYLFERYVFGNKQAQGTAESANEGWWLSLFAIAGWCYRLFIFTVILWFVADRFFGLGFLAAMIGLVTFIVVPLVKFLKFLIYEPRIEEIRARAQAISAAAAAVIIAFLTAVPMPYAFRSEGIVQVMPHRAVFAQSPGRLSEVFRESQEWVTAGEPLFRLENEELALERQATLGQLQEFRALLEVAMNDPSIRRPVESQIEATGKQLERIERDLANLEFRAPISGLWVAPRFDELNGAFLPRGAGLGYILDPQSHDFVAVVNQRNVRHLFNDEVRKATLRIPGQAEKRVPLKNLRFVPAEQYRLPHAALGWMGGGPIEVATDDRQGTRTVDPFFLVRAEIDTAALENPPTLTHDMRARVRFSLPPTPLFQQAYQLLRQLLQERFKV